MQQIILTVDESRYPVFLSFLQTLEYVRVLPQKKEKAKAQKSRPRYDFSDLAGKLEWTGDAVAAQRNLRNEW